MILCELYFFAHKERIIVCLSENREIFMKFRIRLKKKLHRIRAKLTKGMLLLQNDNTAQKSHVAKQTVSK